MYQSTSRIMTTQNIYIICGVDSNGVEFTGNIQTNSLTHSQIYRHSALYISTDIITNE